MPDMIVPDTTFTVRSACVEDAARLTILSHQLGYPVSQSELQHRLRERILPDPDQHLVVAVSPEGEVIGWGHAYIRTLLTDPCHIELGGLVVDEHYRSAGAGEMIVRHIEAWARTRGAKMVFVRSNIKRERAHRFYERIGYTRIKTSYTFTRLLVDADG